MAPTEAYVISPTKGISRKVVPRSLTDLSDELLLKIIESLLEHDKQLHEESSKEWIEAHIDNPERDDEFLYHTDLMNWSCTSSYFRNLLAPYIFKAIKLRNDSVSGSSITALLQGPHAALVNEFYFIGTILDPSGNPDFSAPLSAFAQLDAPPIPRSAQRTDSAISDHPPILPATVTSILSNLSQFPNLDSVSIGFTYPYRHAFDDYNDNDEDSIPEAGRAWRILITKTYDALALNKPPNFKALELRYWNWTYTAPFTALPFHTLLHHLKTFNISFRGGSHAAGSNINTETAFLRTMAQLDSLFLNHLESATSLTLLASEAGPLGLKGWPFHTPLRLRPTQMPLLTSLSLEYIFICRELVSFATAHASTLHTLILHNCAAGVKYHTPEFYWQHLFAGLTAGMTQLQRLEVTPVGVPLTSEETCPREEWEEEEEETEEIKSARRTLREDPTRRLFSYASLDDKYGMLVPEEEENLKAFLRGEDEVAYAEVMRRVHQNANASASANANANANAGAAVADAVQRSGLE